MECAGQRVAAHGLFEVKLRLSFVAQFQVDSGDAPGQVVAQDRRGGDRREELIGRSGLAGLV